MPTVHFICAAMNQEIQEGVLRAHDVRTRFPPEPNGHLHIGHAKSICVNFGLAQQYGGRCHLRFDDTNPITEQAEYVAAIQECVRWLGFQWHNSCYFASDYFDDLYRFAVYLIEHHLAYVDSQDPDDMQRGRGTLTQAGCNGPYRDRSVAENQQMFEKMRAGDFAEGHCVVRLKIDMASPNMNMRDPAIYRIRYARHHRLGYKWCIYPLYDYAHCISDALEGITHSICTLEFEDHRPLYDWILTTLQKGGLLTLPLPTQIEFARLNVTHTVTSKRKLSLLVEKKIVHGWDDPRLLTLSGVRRRGYTPAAIRNFCERIGVTKSESWVELQYLEECVREDLNVQAARAIAILNPLKVIMTNCAPHTQEWCDAACHPQYPERGTRTLLWSRELWIEREDFMEHADHSFFRLTLGGDVRLRYAYIIHCDQIVYDESGQMVALQCSYDVATKSGTPGSQRKVKGNIHWLSCQTARPARIRLYTPLLSQEKPDDDFIHCVAEQSCQELLGYIEPALADIPPETRVQFERQGYFVADRWDHTAHHPVFNQIVSLKAAKKKETLKK